MAGECEDPGPVSRLPLALHADSFPDDGLLDTAISSTILHRVARRESGETIRLHRAGPILAFGKLDRLRPDYGSAVAAARAHGYDPVERIAGGRAAVFHEGTISFSRAFPLGTGAYEGTRERFSWMANLIRDALSDIGVDARVGEVEGEYCPGQFSVSAEDRIKVAGIGQRVMSGAAHVGGVIVVRGGVRIAEVLMPVYEALELDWRRETSGSVALALGESDETQPFEVPDPLVDRVLDAIRVRIDSDFSVTETPLQGEMVDNAKTIKEKFAPRVRPVRSRI